MTRRGRGRPRSESVTRAGALRRARKAGVKMPFVYACTGGHCVKFFDPDKSIWIEGRVMRYFEAMGYLTKAFDEIARLHGWSGQD